MLLSLLFLSFILGGNADVNIEQRRELSELPSITDEAYDASLVIPVTENSHFVDTEEVAVGAAKKPKYELLKDAKVIDSSECKNDGPAGNILLADEKRIVNFSGSKAKRPYFITFDSENPFWWIC